MSGELLFSQRMKLAGMFEAWAKEHGAANCPDNVIAFLLIHGLLDVKNTRNFLNVDDQTASQENSKQVYYEMARIDFIDMKRNPHTLDPTNKGLSKRRKRLIKTYLAFRKIEGTLPTYGGI